MENSVRVYLVGRRQLLVVGTACVRSMPRSTRLRFSTDTLPLCAVLRGRNERTGGYSPQILLIFL